MVYTGNFEHLTMKADELAPQRSSRLDHGADDRLKHGVALGKRADPRFKASATDLTDLETKAAQNTTNAEFHIKQLRLEQLAPDEQRTHFLGADRFGVHRP